MLEPKARKILVIKFRHIGDVLLTSPLISTLKHAHPGNQVSAAVKPGTEAMLEGHPDLDALYVLPERHPNESYLGFLKRYVKWASQLRREQFDLSLNTTKGDRGILLSWLCGIPEIISLMNNKDIGKGINRLVNIPVTPPTKPTHTVLRNLHISSPITKSQLTDVKFALNQETKRSTEDILRKHGVNSDRTIIHIHPTSRWFFKCWEDKFMAEAIDTLTKHGIQVVLTCAPNNKELEKLQSIMYLCESSPVNLGGQLSLRQTAAISSFAQLFFGVDSAPMHMAAAVNTPVVALFGPSSAITWGPWPNQQIKPTTTSPYHNNSGNQQAGPHLIIQQEWECVPCQQSGCERSKRSACLEDITPDMVIPHLLQRLNK